MKRQLKFTGHVFILLLLFIFSHSFFSKVLNFHQFTGDLLTSPLIPETYINPIRFGVPTIELLVIILILSRFRLLGFYLAFFSMVIFTTYFVIFYRVAESHCGCGKLFESLGFYPHLLLNSILLLSCIYLIFIPVKLRFQE